MGDTYARCFTISSIAQPIPAKTSLFIWDLAQTSKNSATISTFPPLSHIIFIPYSTPHFTTHSPTLTLGLHKYLRQFKRPEKFKLSASTMLDG